MASAFEEFAAQYGIRGGGPGASAAAGPRGLAGLVSGRTAPAPTSGFADYAAQHGITGGKVDMTGTYRQWYTGQNLEGPANGWDTRFMETAQSQYVQSLERGDTADRFARSDAVGVVTWDKARGRDGQTFGFGDVVADGQKVGNVYDDFDEHTANVMMGEWTIADGTRKARLNRAGDPEKAWREEIEKLRAQATSQVESLPRHQRLHKGAEERAEEENVFAEIAAGAGAGAAAGATGFLATPLVGAVTTIGGAVLGGLGAFLNQDSISYQIARERERLDMIRENGHTGQEFSQTVSAAAGVANTFLNPLSNLVQGATDVAMSDFDASTGGEFHRTNDQGERVVSGAVQAAEFVARAGDGFLTFANPISRNIYLAQMGVGISGRAAGLLPGVGTWDSATSQMDSVWTNAEGQVDVGNAAAGVGNVAVEAVQLGGFKGLFSGLSRTAGRADGNIWNRANLSSEQRKALKEGGQLEQLAGWKFVTDSTGQLVGKGKASLSMLAPSEALQSLSAKAIARRQAAYRNGAVSSERLHQAAFDLTVGERRIQTMMVNAFGEAQEEGLQQILDPYSHGAPISPEEVYRAAAAGFAMGLGMGGAAGVTRPGSDERMFEQARLMSVVRRQGKELTREEWDRLSEIQKRQYVRSSFDLPASVVDAAWKKMESDRVASVEGDVVAANRVRDWFKKRSELQLSRGTKATDSSLTIVMLDDKRFRPDAVATSHTQLQTDQRNRSKGIRAQLDLLLGDPGSNVPGELDRVEKLAAASPDDADLQARASELRQMALQLQAMLDYSTQYVQPLIDRAAANIEQAIDDQDLGLVDDIVRDLNADLEAMYDPADGPADKPMFDEPLSETQQLVLAKAVSRITTRHPEDSSASFKSFLPQVDAFFARNRANGVAAVSQITNQSMRSDYDGDKVHELQQLGLNDREYIDLRSGSTLIGAEAMPEISTTAGEMYLIDQVRLAFESDTASIRALAARVAADIEYHLRDWYTGIIDEAVIERVAGEAHRALKEGGDVRATVLREMTALAPSELMAIGRGKIAFQGRKYSNQYEELARMVSEALEDFQVRYAVHKDRPRSSEPNTVVVNANQMSTDTQTRRGVEGATQAATMVEVLGGDAMMRMFQGLHYQMMSSTELGIGWSHDNRDFEQLAMFYEQLGRDANTFDAYEIPGNDDIVRGVLTRLRAMSRNQAVLREMGLSDIAHMSMLANLETARYEYRTNDDGVREKYFTGERVSLAQQLLYESAEAFRARNSSTWNNDTTLRSVYNKHIAMTKPPVQGAQRQAAAERAFVTVFESVPLYDMVGEDSSMVGITRTLGQFHRQIRSLPADQRSAEQSALTKVGAYLDQIDGKKNSHHVPYSIDAAGKGEVTVFRSVVDSVFSAASAEISQTRSGKTKGAITGLFATNNDTISKRLQTTQQNIRRVLRQIDPRETYTAQDIRNFIERNESGIGDMVMRLIPDSAMPITYKGQKDGKPYFAKWFYEMLAEDNAEKAEMMFRWNTWLDEWQAIEAGLDIDGNGERRAITYDRLKSRFHRVMYLALTDKSGDTTAFEQLMQKGQSATSVKEFMRWLNNDSGLARLEAPLLAWVDDTADFDATKTGSGWTQEKSTSQMMEDLDQLRKFSASLAGEISEADTRRTNDGNLVRRMKLAMQEEQGTLPPNTVVRDEDRQNWERFKQSVINAKDRDLSYGPRAMVLTTAITAYGMYGQAHTKGTNPEFLAAVQHLESVLGAFGYTVNLERLIGDMTSHNEDAVAASPELIVKDGGRMTDRHGNQIEWGIDNAGQLLEMMEAKPEHIDLVVTMLAPQVMELGFDDKPQRQTLFGNSLSDVLNSTSSKQLYPNNGRPNLTQSLRYLSTLEAKSRKRGANLVQQRVTELVIARTSGLDHSASLSEIQSMTIQAYMDLAATLQDIGRTQPGPNATDPLDMAWDKIQRAMLENQAAEFFRVAPGSPLEDLEPGDLTKLVKANVTAKYADAIDANQQTALDGTLTQAERDAAEQRALALQDQLDRDLARVDAMVSGNLPQQVIQTYSYDPKASDAEKLLRQNEMVEFVRKNGDTLHGMGKAMPIMQRVMRYLYDTRGQRLRPPSLNDEDWATLSAHIISMEIQKLVTVGNPRNSPPAYPGKPEDNQLDKRRYFDTTWAYLADFLDTSNGVDPLVEAARAEARVAGMAATERTDVEVLNTVLSTIYRKDSLGQWTSVIPIQSIEGYELLNGASSASAISMAGLITQRQGVIASATRRTFEVPPKDQDSRTTVLWSDLRWRDAPAAKPRHMKKPPPNPYERLIEIVTPDNRTLERPLAQLNKRFARKVTIRYKDPAGGTATDDVTLSPRFTTEYGPVIDTNLPNDLRVIDIDQLRQGAELLAANLVGNDPGQVAAFLDAVEFDIEFLHPETQPATEDYYNNLWYEGTVFSSAGDVSSSLLYSLWFGTGGVNAMVQQAALDSRKKGWAGVASFRRPKRRDVLDIEQQGADDFGMMLANKTEQIMLTDLGGKVGFLDHDYYNAIYKLMKMKHFVDGVVDGNRVRLTAEEVIQNQAQHGPGYWTADGKQVEEAKLWIPSDQVLTSMLAGEAEIGFGGVPTQLHQRLTTNLDDVPQYRGLRDDMRFKASEVIWNRKVTDTAVSRDVLRMFESRTNLELDPVQRSKFREKWKSLRFRRAQVQEERRRERRLNFDSEKNLQAAQDQAYEWLATEDLTMSIPGARWMEIPAQATLAQNQQALQQYVNWQQAETGKTVSGWVFRLQGPEANAEAGMLTAENFGKIPAMPGDLSIVDMSQFSSEHSDPKDAYEAAVGWMKRMAAEGMAIMPLSSKGPHNLSAEMAAYLVEELGYVRYQDNPRILVPEVMVGRQYMNAAAARSSLLNRQGVTIRRQRVFGLVKDRNVAENTLLVSQRPGKRSRMQTVQKANNLLPINVAARFGVPRTQEHLNQVLRHLEGIQNDPEMREDLRNRLVDKRGKSQSKSAKKAFDKAFDDMMQVIYQRVERGTTLPLPGEMFGTGDMIPLLSDHGELLLYRHGHEFPYSDFSDQLRRNVPGKQGPRMVAAYTGAVLQPATSYRGRVINTVNRQKYGLQVDLEIDAQELGMKSVVEVDGMKWLQAPLGDQFLEPNVPLLGQGDSAIWVDGFGLINDPVDKQATNGIVTNFRNGFAFFGSEHLMQDVANFFGTTPEQALNILRAVERAPNKKTVAETKELQDLLTGSSAHMNAVLDIVPTLRSLGLTGNWVDQLQDDTTEAFVTRAMLLYLMTEGSNLDSIRYSSGFHIDSQVEPDAQTQRMDELFTRMFDKAEVGSVVRTEMFRRFQNKLNQSGSEGWFIDQAWNLIGTNATGEEIEMVLAFGEAHISDDSIELNVQSQNRKAKQGTSMHSSWVTEFALGGETFVDPRQVEEINRTLQRVPQDVVAVGEIWDSLTHVEARDNPESAEYAATHGPGSHWQRRNPAEVEYAGHAMPVMVATRKDYPWDHENLRDDIDQITTKRSELIRAVGLTDKEIGLVDYWMRQMLNQPGLIPGQAEYDDAPNAQAVISALDDMLTDVLAGRFPTYSAEGAKQITEYDLRFLWNAAKRGGSWRPRRVEGDPASGVGDDYGEWVGLAFGQAFNPDQTIHEMSRLMMDGVLLTYEPMLREMGYFLDITMDKELQERFLDPQTNELISVTTSPVNRDRLMETVILPRNRVGYEGLRSGIGTAETQEGIAASERGYQSHSRRRIASFQRKNKIRPTQPTNGRDYLLYGSQLIESNADMHSLSRILLALRHGTTMLNPGLYVSMLPERGFRTYLNGMANVLTGESTSQRVGGVAARVGISQYSPETVRSLNRLYDNMAQDNSFAGMVIKELMYQPTQADAGSGKIVRAFEKFAALGNKWQDPTWGVPQRLLVQHYVESILSQIAARPISNVMSTESVIATLQQDPGYFAKHHPEMHLFASNKVLDIRGLRQTPLSMAARALYEPLTRSTSPTLQFAGTLLKLPLMYATYTGNMLTTITGMQGYSQIYSSFIEGRQKPFTLMNRIYKKLTNQPFTPEDDLRFDMASTMDGYTIANAFVRGGVTQTGLFTIAMLTGGILSGEDEEARRRRKLAQAQNLPYLADPRRLESDFRNKDMFFLDWLPEPLKAFFTVAPGNEAQEDRAAVQLSWILKPFLSPILGAEKFIQTGDFGWVTYGFMDAVGSLPMFNKSLWDDAVRSADELQALAAEQQELGTPESTRNTMYLLISAFSVYERMLFENMIVNSIYTGFDTWDRDPTKLTLKDSDGTNQVLADGTVRENDFALETFVDENGNVKEGYQNRNEWDQLMAYYTENNFTASAVLSLFTGFQKDLWRYSQPVKIRDIELPQITSEEAKTIVATALEQAWAANGNVPQNLSLQEITKNLASEAAASGNWDVYNDVDAIAEAIYSNPETNPKWSAMSVVDAQGNEALTTNGVATILDGLRKGSLSLDHPAMRGVSIPFEMRQQIQDEFLADVMQEGVDMGLTNTQARYRAQRLLQGPTDDSSVVGFSDILWDSRIPYGNKRPYKQLNTTYVQGPDGYPWATGFKRGSVLQALGVPIRPTLGMSGATTVDNRLNTVDVAAGINTGLRGLVPMHETEKIPTDEEIGQSIVDAIEKLDLKQDDFQPFDNKNNTGRFYRGGGYRRFPNYGRRGGGYSGGYSGGGSPTIYFSKQPYLARGTNVFGDATRNVFWDNVNIRRTRIRRERYQSQRGRLNQWQ